MKLRTVAVFVFLALFISQQLSAQVITLPDASPEAWAKQQVGLSTIKIHYHRPAVKEREVWGKLVPYGLADGVPFGSGNPFPWRAGANENTTITFSHDVKIEGSHLKAGTYGLHMIVNPDEWVVIFSNNSSSWGSFFYNKNEDALRVTVKPQMAGHMEWLTYGFDEITTKSASVYLHWEKLKVSFKAEFDSDKIVMANIENQLRGRAAFGWQNWNQAAFYCLQNNVHMDKAMQFIKKSISMNENFNNRNLYGYILFAHEKNEEGMNVFKENLKKYPDQWNAYDSVGEGYAKMGDNKNAKKFYKKALDKAPDSQKKRISDILEKL